MTEEIRVDLEWRNIGRVRTRMGTRYLRKAPATSEWWAAWKAKKQLLKSLGFGCTKIPADDTWEVTFWSNEETEAPEVTISPDAVEAEKHKPARETVAIGDLKGIMSLFDSARRHLKKPKIVLGWKDGRGNRLLGESGTAGTGSVGST